MKKTLLLTIALSLICVSSFAQTSRSFKKGYSASLEIGNAVVFGRDMFGGMAQVATVHGYRAGTGVFVGVGLGGLYDMAVPDYAVSLFLDGKYNFVDNKVSPFAAVRTGYRYKGKPSMSGNYVDVAVGVDAGVISVRLGYERFSRLINGESLSKGNSLFCSFAVAF